MWKIYCQRKKPGHGVASWLKTAMNPMGWQKKRQTDLSEDKYSCTGPDATAAGDAAGGGFAAAAATARQEAEAHSPLPA